MTRAYYLPRTDDEKVNWLNNFAAKLPALVSKYGLTPAEQSDIYQSAVYFDALVKLKNQYTSFQAALTAYKNAMRSGVVPGGGTIMFPTQPAIILPTAPAFDIFGRVTALVAKIKGSYQYNDTDGQSLGIIGAEKFIADESAFSPVIVVVLSAGGQPQLNWKKNGMTALEIEVNRGDGWQYLATDTVPDYIDSHALPQPGQSAVWMYRAIYRLGDELFGQWSDAVSFTVTGR